MNKIFLIVFFMVATSSLYAKDDEPSTKLETFTVKTGTVIIKGYSDIGTIAAEYGAKITVHSQDLTNPSNTKLHSSGIVITVKESGRLERESRAFVDYDEIDSLISGIEYISKATKAITNLEGFEATYKTKGYLKVTVFGTQYSTKAVISIDKISATNAFVSLENLKKFQELVINAKTTIKP